MWTPCGDLLEIAPRRRLSPGESGTVASGLSDPFFDDEGDRIDTDRIGTNPVAVSYRLSSDAHAHVRRRQPLQPPEKRPLGDLDGMSRHERGSSTVTVSVLTSASAQPCARPGPGGRDAS